MLAEAGHELANALYTEKQVSVEWSAGKYRNYEEQDASNKYVRVEF